MEQLVRSSELTSALAKVKALTDRLNEATAELAAWRVYAAAEVAGDGGLRVSFAKKNKEGFIFEVSPEAVLANSMDPDTLMSELVDMVFERLLKEQVKNEIVAPVTRALANAVTIQSKQS